MAKGNRTTSRTRAQNVSKRTERRSARKATVPSVISHDAIFSALDLIDNARGDFDCTFAVFSALIDHDAEQNSPGLIITMERHMRADLAALLAAETECRRRLLGPPRLPASAALLGKGGAA